MEQLTQRVTGLIQQAQYWQDNASGDHPIVSESRKIEIAAAQVEATALVARALDNLMEMIYLKSNG